MQHLRHRIIKQDHTMGTHGTMPKHRGMKQIIVSTITRNKYVVSQTSLKINSFLSDFENT